MNLPSVRGEIPDASGTVLGDSPYLTEVYSMLISGWHPAKICVALERAYSVTLPIEELWTFKGKIPEERYHTESARELMLKPVADFMTDPIMEAHRLLAVQRERVCTQLQWEEDHDEPSPYTDAMIRDYRAALFGFARLLKDVGVNYWGERNAPAVESGAITALVTIGELVKQSKARNAIEGEVRVLDE